MMEVGFYHPDRGYWQTTGDVPEHILQGYPEGTVEVPIKPGVAYEWAGKVWAYVPPDPAEVLARARVGVDAERTRRITRGNAFPVVGIAKPIPLEGRPQDQTVYLALLTRAMGYKSAGVTAPVLIVRDAADVIHQLTPDQMISLVGQAMGWFERVMAASWALKDAAEIPENYADDKHWP